MQRDFYDLHCNTVDPHDQQRRRHFEDGHDVFQQAESVMRHQETERPLRERFLVMIL